MSQPSEEYINDSSNIKLPIVCVVIPCYNHKDYIDEALQSIAEQDYPSKFVGIIDDGSSDDSYDYIKSLFTEIDEKTPENIFAGRIESLNVFLIKHDKAKGPSAARNAVIKQGWNSAHFFGVLDADDRYLPGKLSKSVAKMVLDPTRIGLVYSDVIIHNETTDTKVHEFRRPYDRMALTQENIISNAPLINKLALHNVGVYDESLRTCEDWDLWLRITEQFVAVHIPEPLQIYTVTGENATFTVQAQQWNMDYRKVQEKLKQRTQK